VFDVINTTETPSMQLLISLGRFTFELTPTDVLLKLGKRQAYWSWYDRTGLVFETIA
jgi:hypothetical protein